MGSLSVLRIQGRKGEHSSTSYTCPWGREEVKLLQRSFSCPGHKITISFGSQPRTAREHSRQLAVRCRDISVLLPWCSPLTLGLIFQSFNVDRKRLYVIDRMPLLKNFYVLVVQPEKECRDEDYCDEDAGKNTSPSKLSCATARTPISGMTDALATLRAESFGPFLHSQCLYHRLMRRC